MNARADHGFSVTPLHYAAAHSGSPTVIWTLIGLGADAVAGDAESRTPWHYTQANEALRGTDAWWRLQEGALGPALR